MKNNSLQYEQEFNMLYENLRTNPYLIVGSGMVMPKVITRKKLLNLTSVIMKAWFIIKNFEVRIVSKYLLKLCGIKIIV